MTQSYTPAREGYFGATITDPRDREAEIEVEVTYTGESHLQSVMPTSGPEVELLQLLDGDERDRLSEKAADHFKDERDRDRFGVEGW